MLRRSRLTERKPTHMSTPTPATSAPPQVEKRTIDHIPEDERHGKGRDLFTV